MASSDSAPKTNVTEASVTAPPEQSPVDVAPPIGITPPQILAQDAAAGRRGAAWRLLHWIMENDPRAVVAVSSLDDDRLAQNLLEFIAMGTWAGKPFVIPAPLRSQYTRTRLRTLFLPGAGIDSIRSQRVAMSAARDKRPAVRETAIYILGILESTVPALMEASTSNTAWVRWQCMRALGAIHDRRALSVLVAALSDSDHSVAWMGAKGLVYFGRLSVEPLLQLLMKAEVSPWLVETTSYVLNNQVQRNPKLKPYLEPVIKHMHGAAYRVGTPTAAQKALAQLKADDMLES